MATIAVLGTMDTKGEEHAFVAEQIKLRGHQVLVIDVGTLEPPKLRPDVSREEAARAAGVDFAALVARRDRGEAVHGRRLRTDNDAGERLGHSGVSSRRVEPRQGSR